MPENDFLIVANSATNIESQSAFASDSVVANGVVSGTASSAQINKVLRQATSGTAMLAQMMAGFGVAAIDSGNASTLATALLSAFASEGFNANLGFASGSNYFTIPGIVGGVLKPTMFQWGFVSVSGGGFTPITFSPTFTTACRTFVSSPYLTSATAATSPGFIGFTAPTTSGCTAYNTTSTTGACNWLAIGY